ncbi:50S ribosomal protein L17 [Candidatus Woesebacteria bacterium RIFCSPLOWO2_01_FULL_38_20]|nr:MAG: 50S ribosomal protein L17 [Candidatus Woesebacteria bacterium RIFCSPLOWO2_01_FULL_38_20]
MVFGRKFSRDRDSRAALFRSLIRGLVINGKIVTTKAKAKAVQGEIDKILTTVRKNSVNSRRQVLAKLANDREVTQKLFTEYHLASQKRSSGFTRIVNLPVRRGDSAPMVRLEFVDPPEIKKSTKSARPAKSTAQKLAKFVKNENVSAQNKRG